MKKKGILLAGGLGKRFQPSTLATNKHLLPVYNKPMFFYPLSVLLMGGINDILIVTNKDAINGFKKIISSLKLKVNIEFQIQNKPLGIADGLIKSAKFINKSDFVLILGDNFFYGYSFSDQIKEIVKKKNCIVTVKNNNPRQFGVAKFRGKKIEKIIEKPKKFVSNQIVTGLYVYENQVVKYCQKLKPSKRGELEITDLNNLLIKKGKMTHYELGRGSVWFDAGTPEDLFKTSEFVRLIEERTGYQIANLTEVSENFLNE